MNRTAIICTTIAALGLSASAALLTAGPLNPPPGAVTSTHKTLTEVEPRVAINAANTPGDADGTPSLFKITQAGSYYLTGNITGVSGRIGIEIAAADVTLDLGGFRLIGAVGSLGGIQVTGTQSNIVIRNGVVRRWGAGGIAAPSTVAMIVEDVRSIQNTGHGIAVGAESVVRRCYSSENSLSGITCTTPSQVVECFATSNGAVGISTGQHSNVESCTSTENTGNGFTLGAGSLLRGAVAAQNATGVSASSGLNAVDTVSRANTGDGFGALGASFTNCLSTVNGGDGFDTDSAILAHCRSTSNTGHGFRFGNNTLALHSLAIANHLNSFNGNSGYLLQNLTANNASAEPFPLRDIQFAINGRGRADGNHIITSLDTLWGIGATDSTLCIMNSQNGGSTPVFGGVDGPVIYPSTIQDGCNPSSNYDLGSP